MKKLPAMVYRNLFPRLFPALLHLLQQPYYASTTFNASPQHCVKIEKQVERLECILKQSVLSPILIPAMNLLLPSLFHLYVFVWKIHHPLASTIERMMKEYIRSSDAALFMFQRVIMGDGFRCHSQPIRYALDHNGNICLREVDCLSQEDQRWVLDLDMREEWITESEAILQLWTIEGRPDCLSDLLMDLIEVCVCCYWYW